MLVKLDAAGLASLEQAWSAQCTSYGEDFADYAAPSIEHARTVTNGSSDKRYGIYCMQDKEHGEVCILHGNVARLPKTEGQTLRIVWVLLAPQFDFADVTPDTVAKVVTNLIMDAMDLAKETGSQHVKLHLGNMLDRQFFAVVAFTLARTTTIADVSIRGNWLQITL